jgi:hypothetical protein
MTILAEGFKLFQPWATEVVKGKLNYLVRSISTNIRGRVAVIATPGLDGYWVENAVNDKQIEIIARKIGVVGSVEIKNCIAVDLSRIEDILVELAGKKYFDYYPKYLIPNKTKDNKAFIWHLENAMEFKRPKSFKGGGILWAKLKVKEKITD